MESFVSGHSLIRTVKLRWTYNEALFISDTHMWLIVSCGRRSRISRCFWTVRASWADSAFTHVFQSCSLATVSPSRARVLLRIRPKLTVVSHFAYYALVFSGFVTFMAHRAELTISYSSSEKLIIVSTRETRGWKSSHHRTIMASRTREKFKIISAFKTVIACGANSTALIFGRGSLNQSVISWQTIVLDAKDTIATFGTSIMYSYFATGWA